MSAWSKDELRQITTADDLAYLTVPRRGVTYGTQTWI